MNHLQIQIQIQRSFLSGAFFHSFFQFCDVGEVPFSLELEDHNSIDCSIQLVSFFLGGG